MGKSDIDGEARFTPGSIYRFGKHLGPTYILVVILTNLVKICSHYQNVYFLFVLKKLFLLKINYSMWPEFDEIYNVGIGTKGLFFL